MIAAFLKNVDGDFNYPAAMLSLLLLFFITGILMGIRRAFQTGRILFSWTPRTAKTIEFYVEREKNPAGFWFLAILYLICILVFIALIIMMSFGLLRKPA